MSENHQDTASNNSVTTETKLWLPPSYTNGKIPIVPAPPNPKKRNISWGFAGKSFWEWLLLLATLLAALGAIAIPVAIAIGTTWFSYQQNQTSIQIAQDQQQETILQDYLNRMSDLLLNSHLHESKPGDEVRIVARATTLTASQNLNSIRKGILLQFLFESNLIMRDNRIIDLSGVNLVGVDLSQFRGGSEIIDELIQGKKTISSHVYGGGASLDGVNLAQSILNDANFSQADMTDAELYQANLDGANLSEALLNNIDLSLSTLKGANLSDASLLDANLVGADLSGSNLTNCDLSGTNLEFANLSKAIISTQQLSQIKSLKGAIMPDGSIHP